MKTLQEIWIDLSLQGYKSDKGSVHSYLPIYEKLLAPYRETATNVLEIGLFKGDSFRLWNEYFPCNVYGIDCDIKPHGGLGDLTPLMDDWGAFISIMDATDPQEIEKNFKGVKFDVIIEDAGHMITQQLQLYNLWKPYLNPGGIYIIEDIQDIYTNREILENIDSEKTVEIIDRRNVKERYDDCLVVIK